MTEPTDKAPEPESPAQEEAAALPAVPAPSPARPPRQAIALLALLVALSALALAAAGGYYLWQQQQRLLETQRTLANQDDLQAQVSQLSLADRRLRQDLETVEQAAAAATGDNAEIQQQLAELAAAQQRLTDRLAQLDVETRARQGDWLRAEAVYLARLAILRAELQRDVDGALAALRLADELLSRLGSGAIGERQALHRAINQLVAVNLPDIPALAARIEELIQRIDVLPLQQQLHELAAPQPAANRQVEHPAWRDKLLRAWERFKQTLGQLVIVQRGQPAEPLLAPEERYFLHHNLRLQLEAARLALLQSEQAIYQRSLARAAEWIERYYLRGEPEVDRMLRELATLQAVELRPKLPALTPLLEPVTGH